MELTKVNERYWVDGKEVDKSVYENALEEMNDKFIQFIESDLTMSLDEDTKDNLNNSIPDNLEDTIVEQCEKPEDDEQDEGCPIVESLLSENEELMKENTVLRDALEEYENSDFDVEAEFKKLHERFDKIEFMLNHLQIPITYNYQYIPTTPTVDPEFWKVTCDDGSTININGSTDTTISTIDEPCALATDPEAPKKRTRKSKNER